MRTLKLQVQMTVDGFIAGPNGEMDWMTFNWDADLNQYVDRLTEPVDCILLGRKLAQGFIPHWAGVAADPDNPEVASGKKFTETAKVVFSKTLEDAPWQNTTLATGGLVETVNQLKAQPGGDIITYGGAEFVSDLIKHGLIDDYHLFINPAAIGRGLPIFGELENKLALKLVESKAFECGIMLLHYNPVPNQ